MTDLGGASAEAGEGQDTHGEDARTFISQATHFTGRREQGGCVNKIGLHYSLQQERGRRFHWKLEEEPAMLVQRVE